MHSMRFTELIASNANAVVCSPSTTTQPLVLHRFWCLIHFSSCFTAYYSLGHYTHTPCTHERWQRCAHTLSLTIYVRLRNPHPPVCRFLQQHRVYFFCFYRIRFWLFSLSHSLHRRFSFIVDLRGDLLGGFLLFLFRVSFFFFCRRIKFILLLCEWVRVFEPLFLELFAVFYEFLRFFPSLVLPRTENIHRPPFTGECEGLSGFHLINILLFLSLDLVGPHKPNTLKRPFFGPMLWMLFSPLFLSCQQPHSRKQSTQTHNLLQNLQTAMCFFSCPEQQGCYSS